MMQSNLDWRITAVVALGNGDARGTHCAIAVARARKTMIASRATDSSVYSVPGRGQQLIKVSLLQSAPLITMQHMPDAEL